MDPYNVPICQLIVNFADWQHTTARVRKMAMNVSLDDLEDDENFFIYDKYPRTEQLECM